MPDQTEIAPSAAAQALLEVLEVLPLDGEAFQEGFRKAVNTLADALPPEGKRDLAEMIRTIGKEKGEAW